MKLPNQQIKDHFVKIKQERKLYVKQNELSKVTLFMIEYMESIISNRFGWPKAESKSFLSCVPCFWDTQYENVRKQFKDAFESCSHKERLIYYRKFISYLTGKKFETPFPKYKQGNEEKQIVEEKLENQVCFVAKIKGKMRWLESTNMRLISQRFCLKIKQSQGDQRINLRNYILRKSNHTKSNTYVLCCIAPTQPEILRFSICKDNQNPISIFNQLQLVADNAMKQNVEMWKEPVWHLPNPRKSIISKSSIISPIYEKKTRSKEKQVSPRIKITEQKINDPLKNKVAQIMKDKILQKGKQYNESLKDNSSKMQKLEAIREEQNQGTKNRSSSNVSNSVNKKQNEITTFKNLGQQQKQNQDVNKVLQKLFRNPNFQDPFKKKISPAMSETNINMFNPSKTKQVKRTEHKNLAQFPSDTKSETGTFGNFGNKNKQTKIDSQNKDNSSEDQGNSGKSLLAEMENCFSINEQEQFGNASAISKETNSSFQTLNGAYQ